MAKFTKGKSGNPAGGKKKARQDAWSNPFSGYGTARDRRTATRHFAEVVTDEEAVDLWIGNDIAARAIECYPQDALRGGYDVKIGDDTEAVDELAEQIKDLNGNQALVDAFEYERAYGGAAVWPVIAGSERDLATPIVPAKCIAVEQLLVLEPREMAPAMWKDGQVEVWRIQRFATGGVAPHMDYLHRSRLIYFPGIRVTKRATSGHLHGHGHSILTRMNETLKDFGMTWAAAGALLHGFSQGVLSIDDLANLLAQNGGQGFLDRVAAMQMGASALKAMVLDGKDKFEQRTVTLTGLPEMLDRFAQRLAASIAPFGMPVTKMMGMSPAGMNATGEGDARNWYDAVAAFQVDKAQSPVEELVEFLMMCREGPTGGEVPPKWSAEWRPLWEPSQAEVIEMRLKQAQIDDIYLKGGVLDADEVARNRFPEGGSYSHETTIDWAERARLEAEREEAQAEMAAQMQATPPPVPGEEGEDITKESGDITKEVGDSQEADKPAEAEGDGERQPRGDG